MIVLTDRDFRDDLYPFTQVRHAADIRVGIMTIREKWERLTGEKVSTNEDDSGIHIPANIIPTEENYQRIISDCGRQKKINGEENIRIIERPWNIFQLNDFALRLDFRLITTGRTTAEVGDSNKIIGNVKDIFLEDGAEIAHSILNTSQGPIYIGKNAVVGEGSCIRGPFAMGGDSVVKMGSMIYGATTLGPGCIAGGEIKNSVMFGYSNKAHHGYLGDSVIGEWCNLGAGTSNSNVKNTGGDVKYVLPNRKAESAGNKAGLLMGDYSRCAINTSFNTGSIVGISCNLFGEKMPAKLTPDFSWGNERYVFEKALRDINNWKRMKKSSLTNIEKERLMKLYSQEYHAD